jgi:hypothetical protein
MALGCTDRAHGANHERDRLIFRGASTQLLPDVFGF